MAQDITSQRSLSSLLRLLLKCTHLKRMGMVWATTEDTIPGGSRTGAGCRLGQ